MAKISWSLLAYADLVEIEERIAKDSLFYAARTIEKFHSRATVLVRFPKSGRMVPEFNNITIRELIEGNYRIVYFIENTTSITILRVHHASRLLKSYRFCESKTFFSLVPTVLN